MRSATIRAKLELALAERNPAPFNPPQIPRPETVPTGLAEIDRLTGGIPRGRITEIFGPASSGRTSLLLSLFSQMTETKEFCCLVDPGNAFDPASADAAGVDLARLLWIRTEPDIDLVLKTTDLLLQGGGFGLIGVDFSDIPARDIHRIPLSTWFRLQRAAENTPTILLFLGQESSIKTCASLVIRLGLYGAEWSPHLLCSIHPSAAIIRSRTDPAAGWSGRSQRCRIESPYCRQAVAGSYIPRHAVARSHISIIPPPPQGIGIRGAFQYEH